MKNKPLINFKKSLQGAFEAVERKGSGHPDTLSDHLAEFLSTSYSRYCLENFGAILHHQFDKVGIMGGRVEVKFGQGKMTQPIRLLLNGRISVKFGDTLIPAKEFLIEHARKFFSERYPMLDFDRDFRIIYEVSSGSSPGAVGEKGEKSQTARHYWFEPRSIIDLPNYKNPKCNDTSLGCSFGKPSPLEKVVLHLERYLNGKDYKKDKPWMGNDIKIMGHRHGNKIHLTLAIPQICIYVHSVEEYKRNLEMVRSDIQSFCKKESPGIEFEFNINTRDKFDPPELYFTFTGSSIETGDEGFVGRGNRMGGLISPCRPYTMEGICGKNPVYHTGKMYSVAAFEIAEQLHKKLSVGSEVFLIGQSGQPLINPWKAIIQVDENADENKIIEIYDEVISNPEKLTEKILSQSYIMA